MNSEFQPHYCACGCGGTGKTKWLPGHDQMLRAAIEREVGGLIELRRIIEELLQRGIQLEPKPGRLDQRFLHYTGLSGE